MRTKSNKNLYVFLMVIYLLVLLWSGIQPKDPFTWFLEVLPAILGLFILILTYKKFRFTNLVYILIFIHCIILMVGGHYTYAEVPVFDWIGDALGHSRNNYDKLGHLAQGFIPVMIARELVIRKKVITSNGWRNFILVCIAMAISVTYEFIEWGVALMTGEGAEEFLGTQGYVWDTQSDMFYATIGAILALVLLGKMHDRALSDSEF